jgi:hypothetical protein
MIRLNNESSIKYSFSWDFGNGEPPNEVEENPVVKYDRDTVYIITLAVTDTFGCMDLTSMQYEFFFDNLYVPNAFSPSSYNLGYREFMPKGLNLKDYHIMVFDKRGNLVWESKKLDCENTLPGHCKGSPSEGWDGTFNGQPLPQDVYMWKINAVFKNDKVWEGSDSGTGSTSTMGTVTLIR